MSHHPPYLVKLNGFSRGYMSLESLDPVRVFDPNRRLGSKDQLVMFGDELISRIAVDAKILHGIYMETPEGEERTWCCNVHAKRLAKTHSSFEACPVADCSVGRWEGNQSTPADSLLRDLRKQAYRHVNEAFLDPGVSISCLHQLPHGGAIGHWNQEECTRLITFGLEGYFKWYTAGSPFKKETVFDMGASVPKTPHIPHKPGSWAHSPGSWGTPGQPDFDEVPVQIQLGMFNWTSAAMRKELAAEPAPEPEDKPIRDIEL